MVACRGYQPGTPAVITPCPGLSSLTVMFLSLVAAQRLTRLGASELPLPLPVPSTELGKRKRKFHQNT